MTYQPIIGALGFVVSANGQETLLVHRTARTDDDHYQKFNGLGGKMKPDEDIVSCLKREILEESGLVCEKTILRGTINWTGFGPNGENWLGFIFRIDRFSGTPFEKNEEGDLAWKRIDRLGELPMWEGDRFFLPMVFDDDPRIFHGYMPYKNESPISWGFQRI